MRNTKRALVTYAGIAALVIVLWATLFAAGVGALSAIGVAALSVFAIATIAYAVFLGVISRRTTGAIRVATGLLAASRLAFLVGLVVAIWARWIGVGLRILSLAANLVIPRLVRDDDADT